MVPPTDPKIDPPHRKDRKLKRFAYHHPAKYFAEDDTVEVALLNISASGIQFASPVQITVRDPISVRWKHDKIGRFDAVLLIVREIYKPENKEFPYLYGAQYCDLSDSTKKNLVILLRDLKEKEIEAVEQQIKNTTPTQLMDVIDQGTVFVKTLVAGKASPYFEGLASEIAVYEKDAFKLNTGLAKSIQKIVLHTFHFNLIKTMTPAVVAQPDIIPSFLEKIRQQFPKVLETENLVETERVKISASAEKEELKKKSLQTMNESSNRLFFAKQNALMLVVETFRSFSEKTPAVKASFVSILAEYEKMNISEEDPSELAPVYSPKTKKVEEVSKLKKSEDYSKVDVIIETSVRTEKKSNYLLIVLAILVLAGGATFGAYKFDHEKTRKKIISNMPIKTKILEGRRLGNQIELILDEEWTNLANSEKAIELDRISKYLKENYEVTSVVLLNTKLDVIQVIRKEDKPVQ